MLLHEIKKKSISLLLTENSAAFHRNDGKQLESQQSFSAVLTQKQTEAREKLVS